MPSFAGVALAGLAVLVTFAKNCVNKNWVTPAEGVPIMPFLIFRQIIKLYLLMVRGTHPTIKFSLIGDLK